jgi:hypothetical protein
MFRYFPSADSSAHYTAVRISGDRILQVNSPDGVNDRHIYPSKEEWMATLPGTPSDEQIVSDIANGWNVPARPPKNTKTLLVWAIHLYHVIRMADESLLENDYIRAAYNHLVDVLTHITDDDTYYKIPPSNYTLIVSLYPERLYLKDKLGYKFVRNRRGYRNHLEDDTTLQAIYHAYFLLYQLIHEKVVPFAKHQHEVNMAKGLLSQSKRRLNELNRLKELNELRIKETNLQIKVYQQRLDALKPM